MGVGTAGAQGARAPSIILPSKIFNGPYALKLRKSAHTWVDQKVLKLIIYRKIDLS